MLGTFLAGMLFYTTFFVLYSLHICRVGSAGCATTYLISPFRIVNLIPIIS